MRIATVQKLLIILDVALLGGAAKVGYDTYQGKGELNRQTEEVLESLRNKLDGIRQPEIAPPKPPDYSQLNGGGNLVSGNWQIKKPEAAVTTPVDTGQKPARLQLDTIIRVVGIQAPDMAYLLNKKTSGEPDPVSFFYVGQEVPFAPGATVKRVTAEGVTFEYQGEEQTVIYTPSAGDTPVVSSGGTGPRSTGRIIPVASGITSKPDSSRVEITRDAVYSAQQAGADEVLKGVRIGTILHSDQKPAIAFEEIPASSPLAKAGAQSGDYLVSINSERVTSQSEAMEYLKRNPNLPRYTVVVMRQGRTIVRSVEVK